MAGYDKSVYERRCSGVDGSFGQGHDIRTNLVASVYDSDTKLFVPIYETFCNACGMSLDEIRSRSNTRRPRKSKELVNAATS
jgi:hypothetical protein